ncbi:hypothetical protein U9M48_016913 [Paspalum notatum var. saurae]|uniref:ARGOS-like protein n=1 Tax=Paspalum notatum var. saurae TaxID=547442 RepID=A0AAQ3WNS8_PASNO
MERRPPRRRSSRAGAMHGGGGEQKQHRRPQGAASRGYHQLMGPPAPGYYTAELVLAFLFVAVSLAILPLVLPPLAPPPALLLLLPVGLLAVLVALAFVPLDAHSHLIVAAAR